MENTRIVYVDNQNVDKKSDIATEVLGGTNMEQNINHIDPNPKLNVSNDDYEDEIEGGYASGGSVYDVTINEDYNAHDSDNESSICTEHILQVDPIYIKLSRFLQTAEGENVCNILEKILHQLEELNKNIKLKN